MPCNKMLQNIKEFSYFFLQLLWNTEAETMECYEMIYILI